MLIITGGHYKNRKFKAVKSIRSTKARVREAVFSIIDYYANAGLVPENYIFGDLCCGTGIVGIEALSRGAKHVLMIDDDRKNLEIAKNNIDSLGGGSNNTLFIHSSVLVLPFSLPRCDVIFIDPPYKTQIVNTILKNHTVDSIMKDSTIIIIEVDRKYELDISSNYIVLDARKYGLSKVIILKRLCLPNFAKKPQVNPC